MKQLPAKKKKKKKRIMQVDEHEVLKEAIQPIQLVDNTLQIPESTVSVVAETNFANKLLQIQEPVIQKSPAKTKVPKLEFPQ